MERLIVAFGTTTIMSSEPLFPGQPPVYTNDCPEQGYSCYSTGKLEAALAEGHDVYVVTILPLPRPEDAWWRDLVPPERIYSPVLDARGEPEQTFDHFVNGPWRRFLTDLGRRWPEDVKDALIFRETLDGSNGILYGGRIQGYSGISA